MTLDEYLISLQYLTFFKDEDTKGSVAYNINWYKKRHPYYRVAYRTAGLLLLVLAFAIPLWITLEQPEIALLSGFGAFIVGLASFYSWKSAWAGYYLAQFNLESLTDIYNESITRASLLASTDNDKALEIAVKATQDFMTGSTEVVNEETKGYFKSTKLPTFIVAKKS